MLYAWQVALNWSRVALGFYGSVLPDRGSDYDVLAAHVLASYPLRRPEGSYWQHPRLCLLPFPILLPVSSSHDDKSLNRVGCGHYKPKAYHRN